MDSINSFNIQAADILESISDAFYALDKNWNFVYINKQAEPLVHNKREFLIGKNIWAIYPELAGTTFQRQYYTAMETGKPLHFEEYYELHDTWLEVRVYPSKTGLSVYFNNINERIKKQQEKEELYSQLQGSNALLDALFDNAPLGLAILDKYARYVRVNKALAEINGIPITKHTGKTIAELLPGIDSSSIKALYKVMETGESIVSRETSGETPARPGEKRYWAVSYYPIKLKEEILGAGVICEDITERKRTEEELLKNKERLDMAQVSAKMGIFEWNIQENVNHFSEEYKKLWGREITSVDDFLAFLHPDDVPRLKEEMEESFSTGSFFSEFRIIKPDGSEKWIQARAKVFYDDENKPLAMVGLNMDISGAKKLEQKKDEFISIAGHELKTPLTTIKGYMQLIEKHIKKGEYDKIDTYLATATKNIDKLNQLIYDLLDIGRIQAGKLNFDMDEFDLDKVVENCITNMVTVSKEHNIFKSGSLDTKIFGDKTRIEQVINNFVSNAIKYSPGNDDIEVNVSRNGKDIRLAVIDKGIGIEEKHHKKLFKRFYRVEDNLNHFPGLGIGLYISKQIIQKHEGTIGVNSKPGEGSEFYFTLPIK